MLIAYCKDSRHQSRTVWVRPILQLVGETAARPSIGRAPFREFYPTIFGAMVSESICVHHSKYLCHVRLAGGSPATNSFLLHAQEKGTKEKGTPMPL